AIEHFADKTKGQATGVDQLKTWLTALSEKPVQNAGQSNGNNSEESIYTDPGMEGYESSGGYNQSRGPSKKEQITHALLDAFATNSTKPAYEVLASILAGVLKVGEDNTKSMELAFVTLMKNVSDPNNPAEALLLKAMTSVELDSAPPKTEKEEQSADSLK